MWLGHFFLRARFDGGFYLCVFRYFFSAILRMDFEEMRGGSADCHRPNLAVALHHHRIGWPD